MFQSLVIFKLNKKFQAEPIGNSALKLETLPERALVKIFSYTEPKDRLNLMLLKKQFNDLISNVAATMKGLDLIWSDRCGDRDKNFDDFLFAMLQSDRKYSKMIIREDYFYSCFQYLTRFQSLRELHLLIPKLEMKMFAKLVNDLPILKILKTSPETIPLDLTVVALNCSSLIEYSGSVWCFSCFSADAIPKLERLSLFKDEKNGGIWGEPLLKIQETILQLADLKKLKLRKTGIVNQDFVKAKFQLQELVMDVSFDSDWSIQFIGRQKKLDLLDVTLKYPTVFADLQNLINTVLVLPKLRSLRVCMLPQLENENDSQITAPVNPNVVKSTICLFGVKTNGRFLTSLLARMPNLKSLELIGNLSFKKSKIVHLNKLEHLESLVFQTSAKNTSLGFLNLPELKKVIILFLPNRRDNLLIDSADLIEFFSRHSKLQEINITNGMIREDVWKFMKKCLVDLKLISIHVSQAVADGADFLVSDEQYSVSVLNENGFKHFYIHKV